MSTNPETDPTAARAFSAQWAYCGPGLLMQTFVKGPRNGCPRCWGRKMPLESTFPVQCEAAAKTHLADGSAWCGIHDPTAVARRADVAAAAKPESVIRRHRREGGVINLTMSAQLVITRTALQTIASGGREPAAIAAAALAELDRGAPGVG